MRALIKKSFAFTAVLSIIICFAVSVNAQSASVGDTVIMRMYISGENAMTGLTSTITYDSDRLDLLSYDAPYGTAVCNDTVDGEFYFAVIFGITAGMDFSEKTEVLTLTFIAKQSADEVEGLITNTVDEAYDAYLEVVNSSHITIETEVEGDDNADSASSVTSFVISKYEGVSQTTSTEESHNDESTAVSGSDESSNASANPQSTESFSDTDTNKDAEENSESQSSSETEKSSVIYSQAVSEGSDSDRKVLSDTEAQIDESGKTSGELSEESAERFDKYIFAFAVGAVILAVLAVIFVKFAGRHK